MPSLLTTGAGFVTGLVGLWWAPTVTLRRDVVAVDMPPAAVLTELRSRFSSDPDRVLAERDDRLVRRFEGSAGRFRYRTVEVVTFEPDAVTFEHVTGPFRSCHERFDLSATLTGATITHTGTFRLRGGIWTAALTFGPVKRAFEEHVRFHLDALAADVETLSSSR